MKSQTKDVEEKLLIEEAQKDPSRFGPLYENNFHRVYAFIASRVRNREEAEDLTSHVFHHALANLKLSMARYTLFSMAFPDRRQCSRRSFRTSRKTAKFARFRWDS